MAPNHDEAAIKQTPLSIIATMPENMHPIKLHIPDDAGGPDLKREHPTADGENLEALLYCLKEFNEMATHLQFDGADHFDQYCQTLREPLRTQWDGQVVGVAQTIPNWRAELSTFMRSLLPPDAYEKFEDYLQVVKKPR